MCAASLFCLYMNHAINFFLYAISGTAFREELVQLFVEIFRCGKKASGAALKRKGGQQSRTLSTGVSRSESNEMQQFDDINEKNPQRDIQTVSKNVDEEA